MAFLSSAKRNWPTASFFQEHEQQWRQDPDIVAGLVRLWGEQVGKTFLRSRRTAGAVERRRLLLECLEGYRFLLSLAPDQPLVYARLASIYLGLGDFNNCRRTLDEALQQGFAGAELFNVEGELLCLLAKDRYQSWRRLPATASSRDAGMLKSAGAGYLREARASFERAVEMNTENPVYAVNLGLVLNCLGMRSAAQKFWQRAQDLDPGNALARQYLRNPVLPEWMAP